MPLSSFLRSLTLGEPHLLDPGFSLALREAVSPGDRRVDLAVGGIRAVDGAVLRTILRRRVLALSHGASGNKGEHGRNSE